MRKIDINVNTNIASQVLGRVLVSLIGLIVINRISRYLSISEFGKYTLAFSFIALLQPVIDLGMSAIAIRNISCDDSDAGSLISGIIIIRFVLVILSIMLVALLAVNLGYDHSFVLLVFLAGLSLITTVFGSFEIVYAVRGAMFLSVISQIVSTAFLLLCILSVVMVGGGINFIVLSHLAAGIVGSGVLYVFVKQYVSLRRPSFKRMLSFVMVAAPQGVSGIITAVYYNIDAVLLSKLAGSEAVAYYGAAYRLLGFMVFIPHAIMMVFFPVLSRKYTGSAEEFRKCYHLIFYVLMFIGIPAAIWAGFYADPVITFIYSPDYRPSASVLKILVWAGVAVFGSYLSGYALVSINRQRLGLIISSVALVVNVVLNLILIPKYGITGAAVATLATEGLVAVIGFALVLHCEKIYPFSSDLFRVAAVSVMTWVVGFMCKGVDWRISNLCFGVLFAMFTWRTLSDVSKKMATR